MIKEMDEKDNHLTWDDFFMGVALLLRLKSKDPHTQVGACVVNEKNRIIGIGCNDLPLACDDDELPWAREGKYLETKYAYVCHAELNAVLNSFGKDISNCRIYTTSFPCNECAKAIIQSGIKEVIYTGNDCSDTDISIASNKLFNKFGIKLRKIENQVIEIKLSNKTI